MTCACSRSKRGRQHSKQLTQQIDLLNQAYWALDRNRRAPADASLGLAMPTLFQWKFAMGVKTKGF
jgi:hypothetical protein